jgi:hypothetical protein
MLDRGCDADRIREQLAADGIEAVIPLPTRCGKLPFDAQRYRKRNCVERFFNKLKQFRRIATRYDKLAKTFLAAVHFVAASSLLKIVNTTWQKVPAGPSFLVRSDARVGFCDAVRWRLGAALARHSFAGLRVLRMVRFCCSYAAASGTHAVQQVKTPALRGARSVRRCNGLVATRKGRRT